jgi:shikimate kinase
MDYYSYAPLHRLDRPLVLVGLPGADVGKTARAFNLLTGIPFVWVDRQVEHVLGRSVELVHLEEGAGARIAAEADVWARVFAARTPPVVAASDVSLDDPGVRADVAARTTPVLLDVDLDLAVSRIRSAGEADARAHVALRGAGPFDARAVRAALAPHALAIEALCALRPDVQRVPVGDDPPLTVAERVAASLGALPAR